MDRGTNKVGSAPRVEESDILSFIRVGPKADVQKPLGYVFEP
jgi:hypothetical protein